MPAAKASSRSRPSFSRNWTTMRAFSTPRLSSTRHGGGELGVARGEPVVEVVADQDKNAGCAARGGPVLPD